MTATDERAPFRAWPKAGASRVPHWAYVDPGLYRQELERFFYSGHWCYVGLEAEVPEPGDFRQTWVGERSVIMVRDTDRSIHVVENRCAHRGVRFCQRNFGRTKEFVCPYHQWTYRLTGELMAVPFRRGVRRDGRLDGGMPADFRLDDHGLNRLAVQSLNGVVFASFDHGLPPVEEFLGAEVLPWFRRIFDGRQLTVLGYARQRIPGNWKLMQENIKDPYHPGLLHTWFVTFGLWRADQKAQMIVDARGRHAVMISRRNEGGKAAVTQGVSTFRDQLKLADPRVLDVLPEAWWGGPTVTMLTLFPSVIVQQQVNSLSTRHIVPRGSGAFDFVWTHFGFADDAPELTQRRLRQANLFGPAGYVSADDGEVVECAQQGFAQGGDFETISELGGRDVGGADHMVTESLIRSMYAYYREVMTLTR